jgi:hypothetical protein
VKIYELLALAGEATPEQQEVAAAYAQGLAQWRSRDFAAAAESFGRVAAFDTPSKSFLASAKKYAAEPPGPDWAPVSVLEGK